MFVYLIYICAIIAASSAETMSVQELINANNLFSAPIYNAISKSTTKNFIVSPFSTEIGLAFVESGAKGETADEIRSTLHLSNNREEIESGLKTLIPSLTGNGFYTLHPANKIYVKKTFPIKVSFKNSAKDVFISEGEPIDFTKKVKAAKTMNTWIQKQIKNKIRNVVPSSTLNSQTRLFLLNALYFKASWSNPFSTTKTTKGPFYETPFSSIQVDTMYQNDAHFFNYYESIPLDAKFLEMPFRGEEASMVIVLPNSKQGLPTLETQMERVLEPYDFSAETLNIALPKFKIESRINLKSLLKIMGLSKVFNKNQADLSGIAGRKGDLVLSEATQKTFMTINEGGVEAAVTTDADQMTFAVGARFGPPKNFTVDHPFIFYIKIKKIIVFVGRVVDPSL